MRWLSLLVQPIHLLPLLLLSRTSLADLVNVTIDDQFGDPTNGQHIFYDPSEAWQAGQTCTSCTARPSPASDAYLGTWTDATFNPSGTVTNSVPDQIIQASVSFVGTAVYVVCILTGTSTSPDGNTDMTFKIDNVTTGVFQKQPNGDATYHFNQTVFAQTGLPNTLHTITIESGHAGQKALVLLDSIIYTADDSSTTSSSSTPSPSASIAPDNNQSGSSTNIGVIVGPIVAAVAAVLGISIALFVFLRRRRRKRSVRISIDGDAAGEIYAPRPYSGSNGGARGPDMRNGVQYVVSGGPGPLSEYTVGPSVTSYGYPATTSSLVTGTSADPSTGMGTGSRTAASLSEPDTLSGLVSHGGRTDYTRNIAPSEMGSTVFSDVSSPPAYDSVESPGAESYPSNSHSLPPVPRFVSNPNRKS
ncbi:hypothetical protein M0805_004622 [Coniferiporia weirii]|nr:hypothetical protein M0805_004622 [Coniferiporia weirii]